MVDEQQPSWSFIIICYNESEMVEQVFHSLYAMIKSNETKKFEIIIVDDGSNDGSVEKIKSITKEYNYCTKSIFHEKNLGIGKTLIDGYNHSINENVCMIPADGQFNVLELAPYMNATLSNCFYSFYRKENLIYNQLRTILSTINKLLNFCLLGIRLKDVNWVKIYPGKELRRFKFRAKSSVVETEICAKLILSDYSPIEVESHYLQRKFGISKGSSPKIVRQAIYDILRIYLSVNLFRFYKSYKK